MQKVHAGLAMDTGILKEYLYHEQWRRPCFDCNSARIAGSFNAQDIYRTPYALNVSCSSAFKHISPRVILVNNSVTNLK